MRKPSRRKCKVCGEYFVPKFHDIRIRWCCPEHGAILAMEEREKEKVKAAAKRIKEQKEAEKAGRKRRKDRLAELRPDGYYKAQAQKAFNAFIRARDADLPCISCGETNPPDLHGGQWDCGHFKTVGAYPELRFEERNIHKQCVVCNQHKSGNLVPYRVELINRIGQEAVDEIESNHNRHRWTVEECRAIKAEYQQKLKDLRNSRSEAA